MHIDLIEAYKRVCGKCWSQHEAYERMVLEPAPRYYVSAKHAHQIIAPMVKGDFEMVNLMLPMRREMYYSLFEVVLRLSEQKEFRGKSLNYIMPFAITQPAPRFFISPTRARIIRNFLKNGIFDEQGKVIEEKLPSYTRTRVNKQLKMEAHKKWMLERKLLAEGAQVK